MAVYDGQRLVVAPMPTIAEPGKKLRLDAPKLVRWIKQAKADLLVREHVGGIPRQSAPAAFNFGHGCGIIDGAALLWGLPIELVHASTWKSALHVPADKRMAMARASELFPEYAELWPLKKDEGRAEASMIGLWAWQVFGPGEKEAAS